MPRFLDEQFSRGGFVNGSSAVPTGGTWSAVSTGFGTINAVVNGASVDFGNGSGTPYFIKNSAAPSSADQTLTFEFTPSGDDWVVFGLLRVSGSDSAYQFAVSPGGGTWYTRTSSNTWVGTQIGAADATVSIPASNRTTHTVVCSVAGQTFSASIDGTPLTFGGVPPTDGTNFLTAAGVVGIGARSATSSFVYGDTAGGDITPPTLTSPTGTSTGATTASGTVSTDEANGTLYRLSSTNATETAATVKAAALTQTVTATGSQAVTFTGLTASTTYYAHYVHRDAAGNDSASVSSASFTTSAAGDTTVPTLTGSITVSALTSTSYTLTWPAGADNVAVTGYEVSLNGGTSYASVGNVLTTNITGRTPSSTDSVRVRAFDAAGNRSTPALSTSVTLNATAGTLTLTTPLCNNTGLISGRWISATGIRLSVVNETTGSTAAVVTGRSTDASGVLTAAITDAAIVTGQTYRILPSWSGNAGLSQVLTAT
ncbi:MAG: fibronectin type III domain-containing protein [Rhizobacter sp.]